MNLGGGTRAGSGGLGEVVRERVEETTGGALEWEVQRVGTAR